MKSLTITIEQSHSPSFENPFRDKTYCRVFLKTSSPVKLEVPQSMTTPPLAEAIRDIAVHSIRKFLPQVQHLADSRYKLKNLLTTENPNFFKYKDMIEECLAAVEEAVSIYDPSNYNLDPAFKNQQPV